MLTQKTLNIRTAGRGFTDLTGEINSIVANSKTDCGLCHLFIHHTSASLIFCENADPSVKTDLENFMTRLVPDGDALFTHTMEGPDDMPAHVRSVVTHTDLTVPITNGKLNLGTWQGIYLWEHRLQGHSRKVTITVL